MTAGESARETARRSRERHGRDTTWSRSFDRGAVGEERTAAALTALPAADWTVVHDVRWPGRQRANLDHVVVGPGGVFVIDSKHWSGRVLTAGGELRQDGRRRSRAVEGAVAQADSLRSMVRDLDPRLVVPVLCLVGQGPLDERLGEVLVASPETLVAVLAAVEPVLPEPQRRRLAGRLHRELPSALAPRRTRAPRLARDVVLPAPTMARRPPPAARPERRRRPRGRNGRGSLAGLVTVLALMAGLVTATQTDLAARFGALVVGLAAGGPAAPAVAAPGDAVVVPGTSTVPELEVTVHDVVRVVPAAGRPPRGERLWAAYVVVRNTGDLPHRPPATYAPDLRGSDGMTVAASDLAVRRGRSLDPVATLRPGAVAQGYAVWSLPRGVAPERAVLRGAGGTARWELGGP